MDSKVCKSFWERHYQLSSHGTNIRTEVLAGITTFVTIAYVLILNPIIMSDPYLILGQPVMAEKIHNGVFIGTCLGAFIGTFLDAVYARLPYAQAPGMGLNAFFAYTVVLAFGYSYAQALVVVLIAGILFIIITAIGLREAIIYDIPSCIKKAITPGIGLFITIIGLKNGGLIVGNDATLVALVDFAQLRNPEVEHLPIAGALVALIGLITMGILHARQVKGSIMIGILTATLAGIPLGVTQINSIDFNITAKFSDFFEVSFFKMDFTGLFAKGDLGQTIFTIVMLVISFSLVNMFDSIGTLMGAAKQSGMMDEHGTPLRLRQALMSDAISTTAGACLGTSTITTVVECSAGIAAGGRTGLTSLVTAALFLFSIVLSPIVGIVPSYATAPALIFVGILMLSNIRDVDFEEMTEALPAFCTIVFMPFTYSIANGAAMGLITYCIMKLFTGRAREIKPLTAIIALIFVIRYSCMTLG